MTKRGIQAFAGGIILATSVLAAVFYLTDEDQAAAVKENKTVTEQDVNNYLDSKKMVSVNRDEYQKLLDSKKSLNDDSSSDTKTDKVKTYKLTIKDGMSTADVSAILEKEGIISSAQDFNDYVIDAGYHKEIRAGEFKVKSDMSFKKIVKTLTR